MVRTRIRAGDSDYMVLAGLVCVGSLFWSVSAVSFRLRRQLSDQQGVTGRVRPAFLRTPIASGLWAHDDRKGHVTQQVSTRTWDALSQPNWFPVCLHWSRGRMKLVSEQREVVSYSFRISPEADEQIDLEELCSCWCKDRSEISLFILIPSEAPDGRSCFISFSL